MESIPMRGNDHDASLPICSSNNIIDLKLEMSGQDFCMENFPSSASKSYLQDFNHLDHFPVNSLPFDPDIGIRMDDGFDHFDPFFHDSSSDFELYKNHQENCRTSTGAVAMQNFKDGVLFLNFLNKKYPPMEVETSIICQDPKPLSIVFHDDQNSRISAGSATGRTENSIKNHWNATKRRQFSRRKCRTKWPKPSSLLQNYIKSLNFEKGSSSRSRNTAQTDHKEGLNVSSSLKLETELCPVDQMVPTKDFDEIPEFSFDDDHDLFDDRGMESFDRSMESFIGDIPRGHLTEIDDDLCFDVELPFDLHSGVKEVGFFDDKDIELMDLIP